jgi:hypothetical protein
MCIILISDQDKADKTEGAKVIQGDLRWGVEQTERGCTEGIQKCACRLIIAVLWFTLKRPPKNVMINDRIDRSDMCKLCGKMG